MIMKKLDGPLTDKAIISLRSGDEVAYSGVMYTARDQAHKRLADLIKKGKKLPVDLRGQIMYYCGPTPARPGNAIGSCGPTTAGRMDAFAPLLLKYGVRGMVAKGERSNEVRKAITQYHGIYFVTYAGCGALLQGFVKSSRVAAFPELGAEAIYELRVENFPLVVAIDARGKLMKTLAVC